jgi:hypothetical protein
VSGVDSVLDAVDAARPFGERLQVKKLPAPLPATLTVGSLLAIPMPNGLYAAAWVLGLAGPFRLGRKLVENQVSFLVLEGH